MGAATIAVALAVACTNPPAGVPSSRAVPPAPPETGSAVPGEPAVIWVAGTLTDVTDARIDLREESGQAVSLQRLAGGTTAFFRVSEGAWQKLARETPVAAGQAACAEALLDGSNLVALRVFLGAGCGPA